MAVRKLPPFSFEQLIKPYKEGGRKEHPVKRTVDAQIDWLVNKKNYPLDIVGAALLIVYTKLYYKHIKFEGTGKYGSAGHQLDRYLINVCEELYQKRLKTEVAAIALERQFALEVAKMVQQTKVEKVKLWLDRRSEGTGHWL